MRPHLAVATLLALAAAPEALAAQNAEMREWPAPWERSRPRDSYMDLQGRVWLVETGADSKRLIGFDPSNERFFGTDANTVGRAVVP
jgi:virginiamycin B lyase